MENVKSVEEISERLIELANCEETEEQTRKDIERVIYVLKTFAENEYNADYWRTFYNLLQLL